MGLHLNTMTLDLRTWALWTWYPQGSRSPSPTDSDGHGLLKEGKSPIYLPREAAPDCKMAEPSAEPQPATHSGKLVSGSLGQVLNLSAFDF